MFVTLACNTSLICALYPVALDCLALLRSVSLSLAMLVCTLAPWHTAVLAFLLKVKSPSSCGVHGKFQIVFIDFLPHDFPLCGFRFSPLFSLHLPAELRSVQQSVVQDSLALGLLYD